MGEATRIIMRWFGDLGRADGAASTDAGDLGVVTRAIGAERLEGLEQWLRAQPAEVRAREQEAAIQTCIYVAHADRELHETERRLIYSAIEAADLDDATKERLRTEVETPPQLSNLTGRLTQPVLRELALLLAWDLALADGRITSEERVGYFDLTRALGVDPGRARTFRELLSEG